MLALKCIPEENLTWNDVLLFIDCLYPTQCEYSYILLREFSVFDFRLLSQALLKELHNLFLMDSLSGKEKSPKSEFQDRGDPRGLEWEITVMYYNAFSAYGDLKLTLKEKGHLPKVTRLSVPELRCWPRLVDWNLCSLSQIRCRDAFGNTGEGDSGCLLE